MKPFKAPHEQKLWDNINQLARDVFPEEQRIEPALFCVTADEGAVLRVVPLTGVDKHTVGALRDKCTHELKMTVATLWEAWTYEYTPTEQELAGKGALVLAPPSQHPNRIEVVQLVLHSVAEPGRIVSTHARILRDGATARLADEWKTHDTAEHDNTVALVDFGNRILSAGGHP